MIGFTDRLNKAARTAALCIECSGHVAVLQVVVATIAFGMVRPALM